MTSFGLFAVVLLAVVISGSSAQNVRVKFSDCLAEVGITKAVLLASAMTGNITEDVAQFYDCKLKALKVITSDGTLDLGVIDGMLLSMVEECEETNGKVCKKLERMQTMRDCLNTVQPNESSSYPYGYAIAECIAVKNSGSK